MRLLRRGRKDVLFRRSADSTSEVERPEGLRRHALASAVDDAALRILDVSVSLLLLIVLAPLMALLALLIKLDDRGPAFYRAGRVGRGGTPFGMLKFRKMQVGCGGPPLTVADDGRFTRLGVVLARTKLDEIPQLWNVLRGDMSLVGPRPEDPGFVALQREAYRRILAVPPGVTGLSQLAFAKEGSILSSQDRMQDYVQRVFPQKLQLDQLYVARRSLATNLQILFWTAVAVLGLDVAVNREAGSLGRRRRPPIPAPQPEVSIAPDEFATERP